MRLTLATVRRQTQRALREQGFERVKIESLRWVGERSKSRLGSDHFRCASVVLRTPDGRRVFKSASVDTSGAFRIA